MRSECVSIGGEFLDQGFRGDHVTGDCFHLHVANPGAAERAGQIEPRRRAHYGKAPAQRLTQDKLRLLKRA